MSTPVRVAAFAMALVIAFLGARAVGSVAGPDVAEPAPTTHEPDGGHGEDGEDGGHADADHEGEPAADPVGLAASADGYSLRVVSRAEQGADRPLRFVIEGPDGHPVTAYDEVHDKRLHLVVVRRDFVGYQHVHPTMADDGTWTARTTLTPGSTRIFADFTPADGPALVLGTDVHVSGEFQRSGPTALARTGRLDGYRVELAGELEPGMPGELTATVTHRGEPVTDLQTYLGAYGHLVALREGDLGYLHVHPLEAGPGPEVPFVVEVPSAGRYRMYLDFKHRGVVRTIGFTVAAGGSHDH